MRWWAIWLMLVALAAALAWPEERERREAFDSLHARLWSEQLPDLPVSVVLPRGRGPYRRGAPIPIELHLGAATGMDARILEPTRPSDVQWEWVEVDGPADRWSDPLEAELVYTNGPGVCGNVVWSREAAVLSTHLNEWVFFRRPGRYRFFFRSDRTWGAAPESVSEIVEVEIEEPDEHWRSQRLGELIARWNDPARQPEAARDLAFLGTPEAARFVASRLGDPLAGFAVFLAVSPVEALSALREVPAEAVHNRTYVTVRNLSWMRLLNPFRLRSAAGGQARSPIELRLAALYEKVLAIGRDN